MAKSTATVDLIANDSRFRGAMKRVSSTMERVRKRMAAVSRAARRTLLVGAAAIAGFLKLAADQRREEIKLEAVLKATGNAAGFTATQLKREASELQNLTGIGDEAIIGMQAILATFKEIKGDAFTRVTKVALDMSVVLGQDAKSAAIQLGKALNDPIKGLTALSRSGVTFSKEQETVIKNLVKSGQLMTAQAKILDELESQFGGAAKAIGDDAVGSLKKFWSALGDVGEKIGDVFMPMVKALTDRITPLLEQTGEWVKRNQKLVLAVTGTAATIATTIAVIGPFLVILGFLPTVLTGVTVAVGALTVALTFLVANPVVLAIAALAVGLGFLATKFVLAKGKAQEFNDEVDKVKFDPTSVTGTPVEKSQQMLAGLRATREQLTEELLQIEKELKKERELKDPIPWDLMDRFDAVTEGIKTTEREIKATQQKLTQLQEAEKQEAAQQAAMIELLKRQKVAREQVSESIQKITNEIRLLNASSQEEQDAIRLRIQLEQELNRLIATGANALQLAKVVDAQKELNRLKTQRAVQQATQKETDALQAQAKYIHEIVRTDKERLAEELKLIATLQQAGLLTATDVTRRTKMLQADKTDRGITGRMEGLTATFRRIQEAAAGREPLMVAKATSKGIAKLNVVATLIKDSIADARRENRLVTVFGE